VGETCAQGVLCAAGLGCETDFGSCAPLPGLGAPCAFGLQGPSLCEGELGCVEGTCAPLPGLDQPCTADYRCDPEVDLDGDGQGGDLGCAFLPDGSFCKERSELGEPCETDRMCEEGLFCDFDGGLCAAPYATGAACKHGNECGALGSCILDAAFDFTCQPTGDAVGEPCLFTCGGDLWCRFELEDPGCAPALCTVLAP
jgi:hypothetical protein